MALTTVILPKPLKKSFEKKDVKMQSALSACFVRLRTDPRHPGLRTKRVQGRKVNGNPVYEARASQGDRVTFYWDGPAIVIENHCNHSILDRRR